MPYAMPEQSRAGFVEENAARIGFWANMDDYLVSLLKAWWGDAATADNDYCFDYLPRLTGSHSTYDTVFEQLEGRCKGYFLLGENPAVGSANAKLQRLGMANLDWLVVRDFSLIESATWWQDGHEVESGEIRTADNGTEVFFFPAASHTEKSGSFTNTNRLLQWHDQAVEPGGDARSDLWFMYHLGLIIREKLAHSTDPRDRPILDLTWDYPTIGETAEPDADAVLAEINGYDADGEPLSSYTQLRNDGSTTCGCWIYCGVRKDGVNQAARRKPHNEQDWVALEWAWAWPDNRRILYNRCSAKPDGTPWSERKKLVWWDDENRQWTGLDVPDFEADKAPDYRPGDDAKGTDALSGIDPFIMQADGKAWLYVPAGLADGPLPTHYEPQDSPVGNALYPQQPRNPARMVFSHPNNRYAPAADEQGAQVYPYVATTYRLTEQFTAGGMSRWTPYLSELQPEMFCEVSPELAAEHRVQRHQRTRVELERLGDVGASLRGCQPVMPVVHRPIADKDLEPEFPAGFTGRHAARRPIHRADLVAPHMPAELRAERRAGRTVEPLGLERFRRVPTDVADIGDHLPDLLGRRCHRHRDGSPHHRTPFCSVRDGVCS